MVMNLKRHLDNLKGSIFISNIHPTLVKTKVGWWVFIIEVIAKDLKKLISNFHPKIQFTN
jgi:hypothetical protein